MTAPDPTTTVLPGAVSVTPAEMIDLLGGALDNARRERDDARRLANLNAEQVSAYAQVIEGYRAQAASLRRQIATAQTALNAAGKMCRYHGTDFERLGMEFGEPRCDSCKQPWRVNRALAAIEADQVDTEEKP